MLKKISDLYKLIEKQTKKKKLVLAVAHDLHSLDAVYKAVKNNIIQAILVGDKSKIIKFLKKIL